MLHDHDSHTHVCSCYSFFSHSQQQRPLVLWRRRRLMTDWIDLVDDGMMMNAAGHSLVSRLSHSCVNNLYSTHNSITHSLSLHYYYGHTNTNTIMRTAGVLEGQEKVHEECRRLYEEACREEAHDHAPRPAHSLASAAVSVSVRLKG